MKKLIVGIILSVSSTVSLANDGGPGCGFGSYLFEGKSGLAYHVLAGTTNASYGNQSFGMTSGTLGCDTTTPITLAMNFLDHNMERVAQDIARGEGENLATLADLMGIEAKDTATFNRLLQGNFAMIYPSSSVTSAGVMDRLVHVLKTNPTFSQYVS